MALHARILSDASFKENVSPRRKRSSEEAFSSHFPEKASKRRTIDSLLHNQAKVKSLFPKSSNKKQSTIKNYYSSGLKLKSNKNAKIFNENGKEKKIQKPKESKTSEGFDLMCAEEVPEKYWELLAEERRKALATALEENKQLAEEIGEKDQIISDLKTEVSELKVTAKHAEYLATVLEELGNDCNVTATEDENEVFQEDLSSSDEEDSFTEESSAHRGTMKVAKEKPESLPPCDNKENDAESETADSPQGEDNSDLQEEELGDSDGDYSVNATCNTTAANLTDLQTLEEESE